MQFWTADETLDGPPGNFGVVRAAGSKYSGHLLRVKAVLKLPQSRRCREMVGIGQMSWSVWTACVFTAAFPET